MAGPGAAAPLPFLPQLQTGELPSVHIVRYMDGVNKRITKIQDCVGLRVIVSYDYTHVFILNSGSY